MQQARHRGIVKTPLEITGLRDLWGMHVNSWLTCSFKTQKKRTLDAYSLMM
jgi:hypothetical protein